LTCALLEIKDFGRGLPQAVMDRLQRTGTGSGVGLVGIRERIKELGGDFTIQTGNSGTTLRSWAPLSVNANGAQIAAIAQAKGVPASEAPLIRVGTDVSRAS